MLKSSTNFLKYFVVFSGIFLLFILYIVYPKGESEKQHLLASFYAQNNKKREETLKKLQSKIPIQESLLYKAYLERSKGNIDTSTDTLQKALIHEPTLAQLKVVKEIYLNLMLNAYLKRDFDQLTTVISQSSKLFSQDSGWKNIFKGIEAFEKGRYSRAKGYILSEKKRIYFSPLMQEAFEPIFSKPWELAYVVRCDIALGNQQEARENLKKVGFHFPAMKEDVWNFLMGLTYIKDAQVLNDQNAIPYYQLAFGFLSKVDLNQPQYRSHKRELIQTTLERAERVLKQHSLSEFSFYFRQLETLQAIDEMEKVKQALFATVEDTVSDIGNIRDLNLRSQLKEHFEKCFEHSLLNDNFDELKRHFVLVKTLNNRKEELKEKYNAELLKKAKDLLILDGENLGNTKKLIPLILEIQTEDQDQQAQIHHLLKIGQNLWAERKNRLKSVKYFQLLQKMTEHFPHLSLEKSLKEFFNDQYSLASTNDRFDDLEDQLFAINELQLKGMRIVDPKERMSHLDDAKFLYQQKRWKEAKNKAKWVLKLDKENESAKKLLGFIAFEKGNYESAFRYLKELKNSDPTISSALTLSHLVINDDSAVAEKLFALLQKENALTDETYLKLAFGALIQEKPLEALKQFAKVQEDVLAKSAGRCFAAFQLNSWEETIACYEKLPKKYKELDGYQGIAIESYVALGEVQKAEDMLEKLLKKPLEPSDSEYPAYFLPFKHKQLDRWNRYFLAGLYYKVVKKNLPKALQFFNKIENPRPHAQIEKADLYLQMGNLHEAKMLLRDLYQKSQSDDKSKIQARLLPYLASVTFKLGYYPESVDLYKKYFSLKESDEGLRTLYAKALMSIGRYDLAFQEFEKFKQKQKLLNSSMIDYLESLIRSDHFEVANKEARNWLGSAEVPLLYQIRLAKLLIITKYQALLDNIMEAIREKEILSQKEKEQLVLLWMDLGDFDRAQRLAGIEQRALESTVEGLIVLAKLHERLLNNRKAFEFIELASSIDPADLRIQEFTQSFEKSAAVLAETVAFLQERLENDPDSITLQLSLAKNLIDLVIETHLMQGQDAINQSHDLQIAKNILQKLTTFTPKLPEVFFLLGKIEYLLDQNAKARSNYETALTLNPSFQEAYQYLALIDEEENSRDKAISGLQKALTFDPTNADIWIQLGDLLKRQQKYDQALAAFDNAIKYSPNNPRAYIQQAAVHLETKKFHRAISNLNQALELAPRNIEAVKLMLMTLYDKDYMRQTEDLDDLKNLQLLFFDKLQALDAKEAEAMRERLQK